MRTCTKCNKEKPLSDYYKWKYGSDGYDRICKNCKNIYRKEYARKNAKKQKEWSLNWHRKTGWKHKLDKNYGIGASKYYDKKFVDQNGVCEICGKTDVTKQKLSLDHNHKTGQWRGLLCKKCNTALGVLHADETLELLHTAIKYMEKYNGKL